MEASFIFFPRENNIFFLTENSDPEEAQQRKTRGKWENIFPRFPGKTQKKKKKREKNLRRRRKCRLEGKKNQRGKRERDLDIFQEPQIFLFSFVVFQFLSPWTDWISLFYYSLSLIFFLVFVLQLKERKRDREKQRAIIFEQRKF